MAPDVRPRLYLHGLSLGEFGSADTPDLLTILSDPIDGGLWSGPPFPSEFWNSVTDGRHPDSPQWLPVFRDSFVIRFMNQNGVPDFGDADWGPFRVVYLQYASDPMTFFSLDMAYAEPDWLGLVRGPDVSPDLKFYPPVTFLLVAFDMIVSTGVPSGYGHNLAPNHYIDAWIEVTEPHNWSTGDTKKLKENFTDFGSISSVMTIQLRVGDTQPIFRTSSTNPLAMRRSPCVPLQPGSRRI